MFEFVVQINDFGEKSKSSGMSSLLEELSSVGSWNCSSMQEQASEMEALLRSSDSMKMKIVFLTDPSKQQGTWKSGDSTSAWLNSNCSLTALVTDIDAGKTRGADEGCKQLFPRHWTELRSTGYMQIMMPLGFFESSDWEQDFSSGHPDVEPANIAMRSTINNSIGSVCLLPRSYCSSKDWVPNDVASNLDVSMTSVVRSNSNVDNSEILPVVSSEDPSAPKEVHNSFSTPLQKISVCAEDDTSSPSRGFTRRQKTDWRAVYQLGLPGKEHKAPIISATRNSVDDALEATTEEKQIPSKPLSLDEPTATEGNPTVDSKGNENSRPLSSDDPTATDGNPTVGPNGTEENQVQLGASRGPGTPRSGSKSPKRKRSRAPMPEPEVKVIVAEPADEDVLLGRGGRSNNHHGNKMYLDAKDDIQARYLRASKEDKTGISQELVDRVHNWGGRFLKLDEEKRWYVVHNTVARKKCSQTLREINTPEERAAKRARYGNKEEL